MKMMSKALPFGIFYERPLMVPPADETDLVLMRARLAQMSDADKLQNIVRSSFSLEVIRRARGEEFARKIATLRGVANA